MTRKDYVLIARAFREADIRGCYAEMAAYSIVLALAAKFKADNPRFCPRKFKDACLGENKA